jgi:hypothetical protein
MFSRVYHLFIKLEYPLLLTGCHFNQFYSFQNFPAARRLKHQFLQNQLTEDAVALGCTSGQSHDRF